MNDGFDGIGQAVVAEKGDVDWRRQVDAIEWPAASRAWSRSAKAIDAHIVRNAAQA